MTLQNLITQVNRNCDTASAGQAGHFSLCGLLLRLRQLYKWEFQLSPWQEPDPAQVLSWVEDKERLWDTLEGVPFEKLELNGVPLDPFAAPELNENLLPQGLAYGAGYSRGLAPTFFLGELLEARRIGELTVLVLGPELARDLDATPALCQENLIYARRQAMAYYLWDRLSDPVQQNNSFLKLALETYRMPLSALLQSPQDFQEEFNALVDAELEAAIHHEIGEARETGLREAFRTILACFPQTRAELWVRAVKDALAEVNEWGRLTHLIAGRRLASLAVMLAWRPGIYPLLLPELEPAFRRLVAGETWEALEEARLSALARLRETSAALGALLTSPEAASPDWTLREIKVRFLKPLGL